MKRLRLLLDQMIDAEVADALAANGWDVVRASELGLETAGDDAVLSCAIAENRVLVTLDEHFGDWAVLPLTVHSGVVRIKAIPATSPAIAGLLIPFLAEHRDRTFSNCLVIVKATGVRWVRTG